MTDFNDSNMFDDLLGNSMDFNMYDYNDDVEMSAFFMETPINNDQAWGDQTWDPIKDMSTVAMDAPVIVNQAWTPITDTTKPMPDQQPGEQSHSNEVMAQSASLIDASANENQALVDHTRAPTTDTTNPMPEQESIIEQGHSDESIVSLLKQSIFSMDASINDNQGCVDQALAPASSDDSQGWFDQTGAAANSNDDQGWIGQPWAQITETAEPNPEQEFVEQGQSEEFMSSYLKHIQDDHEEALRVKQAEVDAANTRAGILAAQTKQSILKMQKMQAETKRMESNMKIMQTKIRQMTYQMSGLQTQLNDSNQLCQAAHEMNIEFIDKANPDQLVEALKACTPQSPSSQNSQASYQTPSQSFTSTLPQQVYQPQTYRPSAPITPPPSKKRKTSTASTASSSNSPAPAGHNFYQCLKIVKKVNTICGHINNHIMATSGGVRERCMNNSCRQYTDVKTRAWVSDETASSRGVGCQAPLNITIEGANLLSACARMNITPAMTPASAPVTPVATPTPGPVVSYNSPYGYQLPAQPVPTPVQAPARAFAPVARPAPAYQARGGYGLTLPTPPTH
ncbi:uncharacterized protein RSE6_05191 [Rhynchosporium secalis]|uniref:Uncharacterized protein n=1 Tax=Rhynchosporium secalis TaxID=38038 RepID=A0A1E1M768_RHYSE|nr:uncharacterized protein RSE6_05191 [Rhynchosporium secalis]